MVIGFSISGANAIDVHTGQLVDLVGDVAKLATVLRSGPLDLGRGRCRSRLVGRIGPVVASAARETSGSANETRDRGTNVLTLLKVVGRRGLVGGVGAVVAAAAREGADETRDCAREVALTLLKVVGQSGLVGGVGAVVAGAACEGADETRYCTRKISLTLLKHCLVGGRDGSGKSGNCAAQYWSAEAMNRTVLCCSYQTGLK